MLVILFGATGKMGEICRAYIRDAGYEIIQKKNFVPEDKRGIVKDRNGERKYYSREEVEACDFVYEANNYLVGFNNNQIIDAVCGKKNCLLTFSMESAELLREIKAAYKDYTHVIYTYIDKCSLSSTVKAFTDITEKEYEMRMAVGDGVKTVFTENVGLFDDIVVYGTEEAFFGYDFLKKQLDNVISKIRKKEDRLYAKDPVELPYIGNKPYIFFSYNRNDTDKIMPVLKELQKRGIRIWYDQGIQGGVNWSKHIATKIRNSSCFTCLITENSVASTEVKSEITGARLKKIPMINIMEQGTVFSDDDFDIEMYINQFNNLSLEDERLCDKYEQAISKEPFNNCLKEC